MGEKNNNNTPVYKKWWFWVIIVLVLAAIGGASATQTNNTQNSQYGQSSQDAQNGITNNTSNTGDTTQQNSNQVKPGEDFEFDKLKLNVSPNYSFAVIDNQFSESNGKTVVALPITVTNNDSEAKSLNMYSYKCYGTEGVELEKPSAFFQSEASDFAGNLQPGASYTKNLYFIYDGNGTYKIEFGYFSTDKTLSIDIQK